MNEDRLDPQKLRNLAGVLTTRTTEARQTRSNHEDTFCTSISKRTYASRLHILLLL